MVDVRHSLISNHSIKDLLNSYQIGTVLKCEFLIRGLNDTYKVSTVNEQYIFRIYRRGWREKNDILYEVDVLNYLTGLGCPVSTPIKRVDARWLTEIHAPEGLRYGVLFTFTKGDRPEINQENCSLIGKALGNIHHTSNSFVSNFNRNFELNLEHLLDEPMLLISATLPRFLEEPKISFLIELTNHIKSEVISKNLEYGFCHGDFHNFNMHLTRQNIEAFDFDCCSNGYRSYDLAVFWWNLKQNYPNLETQCWDEFLNGYLSQKSLSFDNLNILFKFVTLRRIWFLGTLLKNDDVWGTHWINQKNIENFITQLQQDAEKF